MKSSFLTKSQAGADQSLGLHFLLVLTCQEHNYTAAVSFVKNIEQNPLKLLNMYLQMCGRGKDISAHSREP